MMQQAPGVPPKHCRRNALWVEWIVGEVERGVQRFERVAAELERVLADVKGPAAYAAAS